MSYIRDAIIRLGVELQQPTLTAPNLGPIIEQEKRLASIYKERATAAVSAETTIRGEYQKTVAVLREIVGLERQRGRGFGGGGGGFSGGGYTQVGDSLVTAGGGGGGSRRSGSSNGRGAPSAATYAAFTSGSVAGGGMGGGGGSSRFLGTYGDYSPKAPPPSYAAFRPGSVGGGGSRAGDVTSQWLMGTYGAGPAAPRSPFTPGSVGAGGSRGPGGAQWLMGSYGAEPRAPATAAAATGRGGAGRGGYDPRNTAFNTGNAFWDRARNRFGYGPFDAIGNQARGWGGAIGGGLGAYAGMQFGAPFGDAAMIGATVAGGAIGQTVGQGVGYLGTTGIGRQMLLRGAEAASGALGITASAAASGMPQAGQYGIGAASRLMGDSYTHGYMGGSWRAAASNGQRIAAPAMGWGGVLARGAGIAGFAYTAGSLGNAGVSAVANTMTGDWNAANDQSRFTNNAAPTFWQQQYSQRATAFDSYQFNNSQRIAGSGMTGFGGAAGFADANVRSQTFASNIGRAGSVYDLRRRMGIEGGNSANLAREVAYGISQREGYESSLMSEASAAQSFFGGRISSLNASANRIDAAKANMNAARGRIADSRSQIGLLDGRGEGELRRIVAAKKSGANLSVEDLTLLGTIAGSHSGVSDFVKKQGDRLFNDKYKGLLDGEFGKDTKGLDRASRDYNEAVRDGLKEGDGKSPALAAKEMQKELTETLDAIVDELQRVRAEVAELKAQQREIGVANPGS